MTTYAPPRFSFFNLSENISNRINQQARDAGDYEFNYPDLSDEKIKNLDGFSQKYIDEIGFFLYPSELFCNVLEHAHDNENLNETLKTGYQQYK